MKNIQLLIIFLLITIVEINAQSYNYEIITKGKNIGTIECKVDSVGDMVNIDILANATVHFLFGERVKFKLNSNYKNNELYFSSSTFYLNEKSIYQSIVHKDNNDYIISKDSHQTMFPGKIDYSGSLLYFVEPTGKEKIYSEVDEIYKLITKVGRHKYKITNPENGKTSFFTYENGILNHAEISHTYVNMKLKKI